MNPDEHATRETAGQVDEVCDRFEQAWQSGETPEVSRFLAANADQWQHWPVASRRQLLEELIKLDLEYRWQEQDQSQRTALVAEQDTIVGNDGGAKRLLLEDYVRQHPELGSSDRLSLELVLEEYRVRQRWGDQPPHQEYLQRFPDHGPLLQEQLAQVDSDLSAEENTQYRQITSSNTVPSPALASGRFGDYELLEEIARGGMGVVYKARQVSLKRVVALKMILSGQLASEEDVRRFRSEAEAAANLQHPSIVRIYEVGTIDGQHYFSMDFIEGHSLADQAVLGPLEMEEAARLVCQVATAIEYAHQQGILHRDLKPHNVLMDAKNQPWVTDFGLAKRIEGQSDLTGTGQVLGTPSYMPPEQASADAAAVGPTSDVYSLGAILYELVTARPPFKAQTPLDTLLQVLVEEPVAPHSLNGSVPADLETIILKCLEKDPRRRYQSAQGLVEELGRYLAGEPIQARPIGPWERAWRWCRRKPTLAALYGTAATLMLILGIGGTMVAVQQSRNARQETSLRQQADGATKKARQNLQVAEGERKRANREATAARDSAEEARHNLRIAEQNLYHAYMLQARIDWKERNLKRLAQTLDQFRDDEALKSFEWHYWKSLLKSDAVTLQGHDGPVRALVCSPDGKWLASAGDDQAIKIWQVETGQLTVTLRGHEKIIHGLSFSHDGLRLASASGDRTVRIWNVMTGKELQVLAGHQGSVASVSFHSDGKRVASGGGDRTVKIWDLDSGEAIKTIAGHKGQVTSVCYSLDGTLLAAGGTLFLRLYDNNGVYVGGLSGPSTYVRSIALSPQGKYLAARHHELARPGGIRSKEVVQLWDVASRRKLMIMRGCAGSGSMSLSFSSDGKLLAAPSDDGAVKVWRIPTGEEVLRLEGHVGAVTAVAFHPDGKRLASAGHDRTVKVWDVFTQERVLTLTGHKRFIKSLAFRPDGKQLASTSGDQAVKLWDIAAQEEVGTLETSKGPLEVITYSSDGKLLAFSGLGDQVTLWKTASQQQQVLSGFENGGYSLLFSPDGKSLLRGSSGQLKRVDVQTGQELGLTSTSFGNVRYSSFSPDGKRFATCALDGTLKVWDVLSGEELFTCRGHRERAISIAFSPDGKKFVSGSQDATVKIWDSKTGQEILTLQGHTGYVNRVLFSPDGKRVASASTDNTVKVWAAQSGREMLTLRGHNKPVTALAFSPDGKRLASGSLDKTIKVWGERIRSQPVTAAQP
jgi:WD40 repeat protein/serine/threonine protein kinase